ncbi:16S rRNA (guanine(527)-N(7))-methyltransferase RsmG [Erythrobacter litoralis]|uniref:Ribosomal RNA small subunit methyltransferase G n=1 Tax=Erythrobacter litoralis (strain HTCC2594) TaxID=314225 RepID=RSMG_ERYLH|nr:16S rRNA (guanine(527)-N(7))-methyltransferase RsmG [Erythrobacter litoralis]Q2N6I7.1 RecName: Full=Ribosomal RNA small subunit methyltransferase G; AltName: Full=16S rRNA 7-methylguanosine methyltransferase; Short=16S rRNA m7G methyltransferase [Erythrobacter litoralis HTCC2594]ABC64704.1 glucose inhibited division protein B [Erythrobacter litoralis HTCC2594]
MIATEEQARAFVAERCDAAGMERIEALVAALRSENERQNLVSKGSLGEVWQRHIADSAQLLDHVSRETGLWLDLGSGAGFPGLVVAAMQPEKPVLLVESRRKRVEWLTDMVKALKLENCDVAGMRLELLEAREAGVISARAFAPLEKLLRLSARFSTDTTTWVLPKGRSAAQELQGVSRKWQKLFHVEQSVTSEEAAILVGRGRAKT